MSDVEILHGDVLERLADIPDESVDCVVTSPPYWGLRDYGVEGQLGLEPTMHEHIDNMVHIMREIWRVLKPEGTLWLNYGDCYATNSNGRPADEVENDNRRFRDKPFSTVQGSLKPKDLCMIPNRLAIALQDDGWYVRSEVVWGKCLSGGTRVYARTQKGVMPMTIKDMVRLDPSTVQLWNGTRWTQVVNFWETKPSGEKLEIELRSGEKIACTEDHRFPTHRGLMSASDIVKGDVLDSRNLPNVKYDGAHRLDQRIAWFLGVYLADGSMGKDGEVIQIAGHQDAEERYLNLSGLATSLGGTAKRHKTSDKGETVNIHSSILAGLIKEYIHGSRANTKGLKSKIWQRDNSFLRDFASGYLESDAYYEACNDRYQISFCDNAKLADDMRTLAARLGVQFRLRRAKHKMGDRYFKGYKGEWRWNKRESAKQDKEVVAIRKSNGRRFWDIQVEDEPHLFALSSGVLTHNSNPMPESIKDRPATSHEKIWMLTKSARYYYDADSVRQSASKTGTPGHLQSGKNSREHIRRTPGAKEDKQRGHDRRHAGFNDRWDSMSKEEQQANGRNLRNYEPAPDQPEAWEIATAPFSQAHFATFPPRLAERCIIAGCPVGGVVLDPFGGAGTVGVVARRSGRHAILIELSEDYVHMSRERIQADMGTVDCDLSERESDAGPLFSIEEAND